MLVEQNNGSEKEEKDRGEIAKEYLNPDDLVRKLSAVFRKETGRQWGHVHFYCRGKSDHIILVWKEGKLDKLIAKSPGCEKGEYVRWEESQFSPCKKNDVIRELYKEINRVVIDDEDFYKAWSSYGEFVKWLDAN